MAKELILVEFDDCLVKTKRLVEKWINANMERFGVGKKVNLYYDDDWKDVVHILGVSEEMKEIASREMWAFLQNTHLKPVLGSKTTVSVLGDIYNIAILTSRPIFCLEATRKQAQEIFGITEVYCQDSVIPQNSQATKLECCKYLEADFFIDGQRNSTYTAAINGIKSVAVGTHEFRQVGAIPLWHCDTWGQVISTIFRMS